MTLKGIYNPEEQYEVNDVVLMDGDAFRLNAPAPAGTIPLNTLYWGRMSPVIAECAQLIISYRPPAAPMPHETAPRTSRRKKEEA